MIRDDFSLTVKDRLAKRVAYRCSNPGCRQPTTGPRQEPEGTVNIGVAAHISGAARGGPRYDPTLTSQERSSATNGIWLCQSCAKLIDNDVERYPVSVLKGWKADAEKRASEALEQRVSRPSEPDDVFRKLEFLLPGLLAEMRADLGDQPLSRVFVIMRKTGRYWAEGHELAYYFEDHPELLNQLSILQNHELIYDLTKGHTQKYRMSERLADHLTGAPVVERPVRDSVTHVAERQPDDVDYSIKFLKNESAYGRKLADVFKRLSDDFGKPMDMIDWVLRSAMPKLGIPTNAEELTVVLRKLEMAGVITREERDGTPMMVSGGPGRYHAEQRKVWTWALTDHGRKVLMRLSQL